jgi:electron transfer flavoprotein alpha subunit
MSRIFANVVQRGGQVDESAFELAAAARQIDGGQAPTAIVSGKAADVDAACERLNGSYGEIWKIAADALAYPDAELVRQALVNVLPAGAIVFVVHDHFGVDLGPGLSIKLNATYAPDVVAIEGAKGTSLGVVRQEFGGQVSAHVRCDVSEGAVITVRPGVFKPGPDAPFAGKVMDKSSAAEALRARRRYLETIVAEAGDVDITKEQVLVSVGRGIQDKDNLGLAEDLAAALGGAVSCSRPVVDAKWLDKSRQVGSSGKTVKPKVYMACGISGSFQHMAGLKGDPFIVAINKNPKAPIFKVASVGVVADVLEFLPALTARVREKAGMQA